MRTVLARLIADTMVLAIALFAAAATLAWSRAWVLLTLFLAIRIVSALVVFRVNPALLRERATGLIHRRQPTSDRVILLAFLTSSFVALPAVAAFDVFRWRALPHVPTWVASAGLVLFASGWVIIALAMRANAFAVAVVRMQGERQHAVADAGAYRIVRHPMYAGSPLVNVGMSLWLGSYVAALLAVVPLVLLVVRIGLEERMLRRDLPGYQAYTARVPYRLIPGIW